MQLAHFLFGAQIIDMIPFPIIWPTCLETDLIICDLLSSQFADSCSQRLTRTGKNSAFMYVLVILHHRSNTGELNLRHLSSLLFDSDTFLYWGKFVMVAHGLIDRLTSIIVNLRFRYTNYS